MKLGWWAYRPLEYGDGGEDDESLIKECKTTNGLKWDRCLGGPNSSCMAGHGGPLCAVCEPAWYKGTSYCQACDGRGTNRTYVNGTFTILGRTYETVEYDADTHVVAYGLHLTISFLMALGSSIVVTCVWRYTKDPLQAKKKKGVAKDDEEGEADGRMRTRRASGVTRDMEVMTEMSMHEERISRTIMPARMSRMGGKKNAKAGESTARRRCPRRRCHPCHRRCHYTPSCRHRCRPTTATSVAPPHHAHPAPPRRSKSKS